MGSYRFSLREIADKYTNELGDLGTKQLAQSLETNFNMLLKDYRQMTDYRARAWFLRCVQFGDELAKYGTMTPSSPPVSSHYGSWWFSMREKLSREPTDQESEDIKWYVERLMKQCLESTGAINPEDFENELTPTIKQQFVVAQTIVAEQARQSFLDNVTGTRRKSSLAFVGVYPPPTSCKSGVWHYQIHVKTHQDFAMEKVFFKEAAAEEIRLRSL